ncbi:MAG: NUDIX hydrolase [bacterium]|nr:NUDIX hydrolase [bacterium]
MRKIANAAIIRDNRVLLVQEKDRTVWTFPGGGIETHESDEMCLRRELREELEGIESVAFAFLTFFYGTSVASVDSILIFLYRAEVLGRLLPGQNARHIAWVMADTSYPVTEATKSFLQTLKDRGYLA